MSAKFSEEWWSCPAESDNGRTVIVTGRRGMDALMESGRFRFRVDVSWDYESDAAGMPVAADAARLEEITEALQQEFRKDPMGVMTGIYTGDGRREWIFYTGNLNIFQRIFNRALEPLPLIPLVISAQEDAEWAEYREMREISYIPPED